MVTKCNTGIKLNNIVSVIIRELGYTVFSRAHLGHKVNLQVPLQLVTCYHIDTIDTVNFWNCLTNQYEQYVMAIGPTWG